MTSRRMAYGIFMALTTELASVARAFPIVARRSSFPFPPAATTGRSVRSALYSTTTDSGAASSESPKSPQPDPAAQPAVVPIYLAQGLFAVDKPLDWTSSNVVSYIRRMLERDARERGAKPGKVGRSKRSVKVGHGGTLDPLATGVLVIGVGSGTKELQHYLSGAKRYAAGLTFGYETNTLDAEGNVTQTAPFDHITLDAVQQILPDFTGQISQIPPIFSAIRKDGKRLYEHAREGAVAEDVQIPARPVHIYELAVTSTENFPPTMEIDVACGGGTYIRSLVRDMAYAVDSVATTTMLRRTQQGPFGVDDCLLRDDWTVDAIYAALERSNAQRVAQEAESITNSESDSESQ